MISPPALLFVGLLICCGVLQFCAPSSVDENASENGVVNSVTEGLEIKKMTFKSGTFSENLDPEFTYSYYLLDGEIILDGENLIKDDFYVLQDATTVSFNVEKDAELFVIKTPTDIKYRRFIERY